MNHAFSTGALSHRKKKKRNFHHLLAIAAKKSSKQREERETLRSLRSVYLIASRRGQMKIGPGVCCDSKGEEFGGVGKKGNNG